jgi:hypothetical protein
MNSDCVMLKLVKAIKTAPAYVKPVPPVATFWRMATPFNSKVPPPAYSAPALHQHKSVWGESTEALGIHNGDL